MPDPLVVVLSQGPSDNPAKRGLEASLVSALMQEPGIDVRVVPHLYDLSPRSRAVRILQQIAGDMVLMSWLFERAAYWVLQASGIRGCPGAVAEPSATPMNQPDDADTGSEGSGPLVETESLPQRIIYCLDLKTETSAESYLREIRHIVAKRSQDAAVVQPRQADQPPRAAAELALEVQRDLGEPVARRWYPVIDYSRCTNCLECIDFCLFGVYGVDLRESIIVEQPDLCRKGCPACSRVCPDGAIMFPQHKTPAIAGAAGHAGPLKMDLSSLFGAPEPPREARELARAEREQHQQETAQHLDRLLDQLDEFDRN